MQNYFDTTFSNEIQVMTVIFDGKSEVMNYWSCGILLSPNKSRSMRKFKAARHKYAEKLSLLQNIYYI